jgi:hypothetical protein
VLTSLEKLFERHDALRANFVHKPGHQILQVVAGRKTVDFSFFDIIGEVDALGEITSCRKTEAVGTNYLRNLKYLNILSQYYEPISTLVRNFVH